MATAPEALHALHHGEVIDLLDPDLYLEPDAVYAWLRANAPVYKDRNGIWWISRHGDLQLVEGNAARYTSHHGSRPQLDMTHDESMINLDDPRHAEQRRLVVRRFTPRGLKPHAERVRHLARDLVDGVARRGRCEVVGEVASVLPAMVICELLGFPHERWADCRRWAQDTLGAGCFKFGDPRMPDFGPSLTEFIEETTKLAEHKRRHPGDDLMTVWVNATVGGEPLAINAILDEALLVLDGGAETTRHVIAGGLLAMIEHPDQRALIDADRSILERGAVEELIRWVTPILNMRRTVTEDHELHGQPLRAGEEVVLMYGSANCDPHAFADPDTLDLRRPSNHHVAFGHGTHYCLGANLARYEIRVMFEEIWRAIPDFRIAPGTAPAIGPSFFTRGLSALELAFTPPR